MAKDAQPGPERPCAVLIVAAGRGSRARIGDASAPKQYALIGDETVLACTISVFGQHPLVTRIQVVIRDDDQALFTMAIRPLANDCRAKLLPPVLGGATRQASVRLGLEALSPDPPLMVLVHDAARPFVSADTISGVVRALAQHQAAIAALPVTDTIKQAASDQTIARTIPREQLWRAQTPQGFHFDVLLKAHRDALSADETSFTDDAAVAEWAGLDVALVEGNTGNIKLTTAEDLRMANQESSSPLQMPDIRTGGGFDVHRLIPGDHVWLCGVKIAHDMTLDGHSDADVGLHALTDALLGAIGDGDIGTHFPPSDPQWKGAASDKFLADAARRVGEVGGRITNVDLTLLCETPKIGPHREAMRVRLAGILNIEVSRVSVKATTTERLGFTGRGEGIAAMASATVAMM